MCIFISAPRGGSAREVGGGGAVGGRGVEFEGGVIAHGACQLHVHLHIGHAVAQRLEVGDRHAELPALVHVGDGGGQGLVHHAHGFGAGGGNAGVQRQFQRGQAIGGDQGGGGMGQP